MTPTSSPSTPPPSSLQPPASTARAARMLRACIWLFVFSVVLIMGILKPLEATGVDYDKHWFAARALLEGRSCYLAGTLWMGFNYPQAAAMPFFWLGFFSVKTGEYLWKAMLLGLVIACWWMAWRFIRPNRSTGTVPDTPPLSTVDLIRAGMARHWGLVTALLTASYYAATSALYIGNIDPVNAFLAVAMAAALFAGAPLVAGGFWAMLTLVKMMPLMLIVPVLLWRQWRVLQGFLLVMAGYFLILVALGRVGEEWYFVREAMPAIPRWWRVISVAPVALFARWYHGGVWMADANAFAVLAGWNELVLLLAFLAVNWAMRRRRLPWLLALEGAIVCYPLLSPLLEYHHYVWIMPALYMQARRWARGEMSPRMAVALALAWTLLDSAYYIVDLWPSREGIFLHFASLPGYLAVLALTLLDLFCSPGTADVPVRPAPLCACALQVQELRP